MCNYIVQHLASGDYKTCMYLLRESFAGRYGML